MLGGEALRNCQEIQCFEKEKSLVNVSFSSHRNTENLTLKPNVALFGRNKTQPRRRNLSGGEWAIVRQQ